MPDLYPVVTVSAAKKAMAVWGLLRRTGFGLDSEGNDDPTYWAWITGWDAVNGRPTGNTADPSYALCEAEFDSILSGGVAAGNPVAIIYKNQCERHARINAVSDGDL